MKMKRSLRSLASSIFIFFLSLITINAFAGGPEIPSFNPWTISLGIFGAIYGAHFKHESVVGIGPVDMPITAIRNYTHYTKQFGYGGGGQVGIRYHLERSYLGLELSAQGNSRQGNNDSVTFVGSGFLFLLQNEFRINSNVDLTGILDTDLTSRTHMYGKLGVSYAKLNQKLTVSQWMASLLQTSVQQKLNKNLWGYVAGLGIAEDLGRGISLFAEYDYYDYGKNDLKTLRNIFPSSVLVDIYTQKVLVGAYTIRVGFNIEFAV
ncbi:outer membrane protein [Coxiella burnetii]|uniref:outer membrane protein n=1 Tax=Coxiella burnetii TaxID=777 RepID=UPI0000ED037D|nr:outer membrane beta-barrel protein [Coxiella burnetii]ACJ20653.1 hypothetical exported protein [Coxiella burnetii CbuK_Q154]AIT63721.1 putative exported protein [Coxiella burnetii str. Namibia]ATN86268.1 hypothetical protein AYO29_07360 [Coxiella burnetii str. Schperling]EAX33008.1 hypothetical protein A35_07565 [Coxiella burnetii 'MSU Goat Q177']PHH57660.1 hypothetical protein CRH12_04225 [Coxiella burnetii]